MSKKDDEILSEAKERFKLCQEAEADNREQYEDDVKFARLGEQWPIAIKKQREAEGRPCLTINRMPAFLRQVINDARINTPTIKAHPVDSSDDIKTAEVINGLIRNIEVSSNADIAYDTALECAVTGGFGYFRIDVDYSSDDSFDKDIKVERIVNPLTVYGDPASSAADASDWRFGFITEMVPRSEFERRWKGSDAVDWDSYGNDPDWTQDDSVRVAEYWTREEVERTICLMSNGSVIDEKDYESNRDLFDAAGITCVDDRVTSTYKVTHRIITCAEILEETEWAGRYIPIIPVYGDEVFIDGKRHFLSLIRFAKDAQRQYNYWRTTSTELVALSPKAPFIGPEGAFDVDAEKWATANTKSHAYIEYSGNIPPQRQPFSGPPAGAIQEALNASDDMKSIMGIFDASLGARSNETSGKAILARQREGDVGTFNFIDNLSRAMRYAGRVIIDLLPSVYNTERVIRVIGEDGSNKSVTINGEYNDHGVSKLHDLTLGKYDVTVETGPSFTTQRQESANQMMELLRSFPQAAQYIGDLVAKNLDWPGADKIADRLKLLLPPQIQKAEAQQGIPPEAQAMIASMDAQMQQMHQQMQEGMKYIQQLQGENSSLKQDMSIEQQKIAASLEEARLDAMTKLQLADKNNQSDQQEIILKAYLDRMSQAAEQMRSMLTQQPAQPNIVIHNSKPKRKNVAIQAPSGAVYQGVIEEEDDEEGEMPEME